MTNNARCVLLLIVLLWQSLVMAGPLAATQIMGDLEHTKVHYQETGHHHHMDQSLHLDSADDAQPMHIHADTGSNTVGLLLAANPTLTLQSSSSPPDLVLMAWLSPDLDGLLRPPKHTA